MTCSGVDERAADNGDAVDGKTDDQQGALRTLDDLDQRLVGAAQRRSISGWSRPDQIYFLLGPVGVARLGCGHERRGETLGIESGSACLPGEEQLLNQGADGRLWDGGEQGVTGVLGLSPVQPAQPLGQRFDQRCGC